MIAEDLLLTASDPLLRLRYPDHVRLEVLPRSDDEDEDHVDHGHGSKRGDGDGDSDEEEHDERVLLHHALHNSRAHHMGVQPLQQLEDGDDSDHSDDDDDDDDGGDDDDDGEGDDGSVNGGDEKVVVAQRTSKKQDVGRRGQGVPAGARPAGKAGAGAASDSEESGSADGNHSDGSHNDDSDGDDDDDEMPRRTLALPSYTAHPLGLLVRNGSNFTRMSELEALCREPGDDSGDGGAAGEAVEDRDSQAAMMARALVMVLAQQGLLEGRAKFGDGSL